MTIPNDQSSVEATFSASTDVFGEGWESVVFTPQIGSVPAVVDDRAFMAFIRDTANSPELLSESDYDLDGLPDRWELANQFDPFTPGEAELDTDKDGLTNLEESQAGTQPRSNDSDSDGQSDFVETVRDPLSDDQVVELILRTDDSGKSNDGVGCAVCHTTILKVGDFSHFSPRNIPVATTDKSIYLRKGTNYPIYLRDLFRDFPPDTGNIGSPTNSAKYDAEILPPPNTPRQFFVTDPGNRLGTNKSRYTFFPTDPTVPIGTVTVARIEVSWTNVVGNVALDTNSNVGDGLRVFPDRLTPTDGTARNLVRVRVRTTPPMAGQVVRLKSFDVDDPMYPNDPGDTFVDTNDVAGAKGEDNRGTPLAGQLAGTLLTLNPSGEALTNFTVTMQPGNNFRVAAILDTSGAQAHLDKLQVTNATAPFYVPADSNPVKGFAGTISPMLTVWRKLHLEFDSMTAPSSNIIYASGSIDGARTNYPVAGRSQIKLSHLDTKGSDFHLFHRGKLEIGGVTYKVIDSQFTAVLLNTGAAFTTVDIQGVPPVTTRGTAVKLFADDDQYLTNDLVYPSLLTLQSPPLPLDNRSVEFITNIQHRFWDAYIQPVSANTNGLNTQPTIPFIRHADLGATFDFGNQQLKGADAPAFWAYTVIFAYEPGADDEDGDPNTEIPLDGVTQKRNPILLSFHGYSVIYMESIRESIFAVGRKQPKPVIWQDSHFSSQATTNTLRREYLNWLYGVIAHEIGHAPGGQWQSTDHAESGLMQDGGDFINGDPFFPRTIRRFRDAEKWLP
jgi:hypothetical protein